MPTFTPKVTIQPYSEYPGLHVITVWEVDEPVDYTHEMGYVFGAHDQVLAERMKAAIEAGVIFINPRIITYIDGKTYVRSDVQVWGKYANKDLKKLGF